MMVEYIKVKDGRSKGKSPEKNVWVDENPTTNCQLGYDFSLCSIDYDIFMNCNLVYLIRRTIQRIFSEKRMWENFFVITC